MLISSKKDLEAYILADALACGSHSILIERIRNPIFRFQYQMRQLEYLQNCKASSIRILIAKLRFRRTGTKLGYSISPNTFGPGLSIAHRGTVVVNGGSRIGANCRIHVGVNIGTEAGKSDSAPTIGDNCYIGPGAKIFGPIEIGSGTVIGANAVVNKSFPQGNQTIAGIPAKVISGKSSEGFLIKGFN